MIWIVKHRDTLSIGVQVAVGVTAFEVRAFVAKRWGVDPGGLQMRVGGEFEADCADVEVRFEGNDYSSGGTPNARRMQFREYNQKTRDWGEWVDDT